MTGYQLHDTETQEILGSVIITTKAELMDKSADSEKELIEGWDDFNRLHEHEGDHTNVDEFVIWFNEGYVTQIERLYLEFIQP